MKTKYEIIENYKKHPSGTFYNAETTDEMINILENIAKNKTRCQFYWGDTKTGRDWEGKYGIIGRIGRSTGSIKIPLLVYNNRSVGGSALLSHCIVKIVTSRGKNVIYQHPNYHKK